MLSFSQKAVLRTSQRTGTATKEELRKSDRYWRSALNSLIGRGIIQSNKDNYSVTSEGGKYMLEIEDNMKE